MHSIWHSLDWMWHRPVLCGHCGKESRRGRITVTLKGQIVAACCLACEREIEKRLHDSQVVLEVIEAYE